MPLVAPRVFDAALGGVRRQIENFGAAAAEVVQVGSDHHERVEVSDAARSAAAGNPEALGAGLEQAMVDLRVAKYLAVANMRVLSTADEVTGELLNVAPRR